LVGHGGSVGIVAAGERWPDGTLRPAYEDWIGAGAVVAALGGEALSAEAGAASAAFEVRRPLAEVASGAELAARGFAADVQMAEEDDADDVVPLLVYGGFSAG
jgi:2-phosphosulfolactate phosphatase